MRDILITEYNNLVKNKSIDKYSIKLQNTKNKFNILTENKLTINFINGPVVEINGNKIANYLIKFINSDTNQIVYETTISNNMWAKCAIQYCLNWKIEVYEDGKLWNTHIFNPNNKRVYIALDSTAIGDTLAWIPYVDEFRKTHNCNVICSTFHNALFEETYPHIEFVSPGTVVTDLYAIYLLGLYYLENNTIDFYKNPLDPKDQPLQKIACDILGLRYDEIRPKLKTNSFQKEKQVTIAIHGTTQAKYWNNPNGWQEVVDWLNDRGYKVKLVSREGSGYMGNVHPNGIEQLPSGPLSGVMDEMLKSEVFIGIGSGLSWLSWALHVPTVLISGFSYDWCEMKDCIRISAPSDKCSGCFNRVRLDAGDWNWCPDYKGTDRQYECTKSITSKMVIDELEKILKYTK